MIPKHRKFLRPVVIPTNARRAGGGTNKNSSNIDLSVTEHDPELENLKQNILSQHL